MRALGVALLRSWINPTLISLLLLRFSGPAQAAEPSPPQLGLTLRPIVPLSRVNGVEGMSVAGLSLGHRADRLELEVGGAMGTVFTAETLNAWLRGGVTYGLDSKPGFDLSYPVLGGLRYSAQLGGGHEGWDEGTAHRLGLSAMTGLDLRYRWPSWALSIRLGVEALLPLYYHDGLDPEAVESGWGGDRWGKPLSLGPLPFGWDLTLGFLF